MIRVVTELPQPLGIILSHALSSRWSPVGIVFRYIHTRIGTGSFVTSVRPLTSRPTARIFMKCYVRDYLKAVLGQNRTEVALFT